MNDTAFRRARAAWLSLALLLPWLAGAAQAEDCARPGRALLSLESTLAGARLAPRPASPAGPIGYLPFLAPSAVAARGNIIYVLDSGRRQIFVYDQSLQTMAPLGRYDAGSASALAPGADLSLYVADVAAQQVLHFSLDGRALPGFKNAIELARPAALALAAPGPTLYVADSLYRQVVVFSSLGRVLGVLRPDPSGSIDAMARGPDGLYLVDRGQRQVLVLDPDGIPRYALGKGSLVSPGALAVDRYNRVFVAEGFDNTVKVYGGAALIASEGAGRFSRIAGMWIENNMLYVADSGNARVFVLRIAPPCAPEALDAR